MARIMAVDSQTSIQLKSQLYPWIILSLLKDLSVLRSSCPPFKNTLFFSTPDSTTHYKANSQHPENLNERPDRGMGMHFKSATGLVEFFENKRTLPGQFKGFQNISEYSRFIVRLLAIKNYLKILPLDKLDHSQLETKILATLFAACSGINALIEYDNFTNRLYLSGSRGLIIIRIQGKEDALLYVELNQGHLIYTREKPLAAFDKSVDLQYESMESAWLSVSNQADNLALVGKGSIRMRGYVPLADSFNHLLDRLQMFVSL